MTNFINDKKLVLLLDFPLESRLVFPWDSRLVFPVGFSVGFPVGFPVGFSVGFSRRDARPCVSACETRAKPVRNP